MTGRAQDGMGRPAGRWVGAETDIEYMSQEQTW